MVMGDGRGSKEQRGGLFGFNQSAIRCYPEAMIMTLVFVVTTQTAQTPNRAGIRVEHNFWASMLLSAYARAMANQQVMAVAAGQQRRGSDARRGLGLLAVAW